MSEKEQQKEKYESPTIEKVVVERAALATICCNVGSACDYQCSGAFSGNFGYDEYYDF